MDREQIYSYLKEMPSNEFTWISAIYEGYSRLEEDQRGPFLRELDGFDRGLIKEIAFMETIVPKFLDLVVNKRKRVETLKESGLHFTNYFN